MTIFILPFFRCLHTMRHFLRPTNSRKSFFLSVAAIVIFTLCNFIAMIIISLTVRSKNDKPLHRYSLNDSPPKPEGGLLIGNLLSSFVFNFNQTSSRTDGRRTYIIHDSVVVGNAYESYPDSVQMTLATQCSVDRLNLLMEVADSWKAPMSVAVFVPGIDFHIAKVYIAYLRLCSQVIRTNATFHFLYHRDMSPDTSSFGSLREQQVLPSCFRKNEALPLLLRYRTGSFKRWWQQALHPQNHLRNVARHGVRTPYHFLTDIDIRPVIGLAHQLDVFLTTSERARSCPKCVYVVPTYEMSERLPVPRTKTELLETIKKKQSRPFHAKVFIHNQFATNHSLWEKIPDSNKLEAVYKINNYEFFYEPFYVARANVPLYDERFIGYGFTRNTQVRNTFFFSVQLS